MKHAPPAPPELGTHDGLSYGLFLPEGEPTAGVVVLHGAGSAKESHFDFCRLLRESGLAALAYDARGHGRSDGEFGPPAIEDALEMCQFVRQHAPKVALRGSSMGGSIAIHAGALDHSLCAIVSICPAPEDFLLRGLRQGFLTDFEVDRQVTEPWLESISVYDAVGELGPETRLLLLHARGDEQIPYTVSKELYAAAHEPKRLLILPGGHHRSLQHDMEIQSVTRSFVEDAARQVPPVPPPGD